MTVNVNIIPTVDISPYISPTSTREERDAVVTAVRDACVDYGFFQVVGHGVPLELQTEVLECSRKFFSLPMEEKMELSQKNAMGMSARGYEVLGGQTLQNGALPDLKEGYFIGAEIPANDPRAGKFLQGPNLWPKSLAQENFEAPLQDYRGRMVEVAEIVLELLALGLPPKYGADVFDDFTINPSANLRLLHYPPQKTTDERQLGAGAHTDFGGLTFVLQQPNTTGLQVFYPPTQTWIPVPARPNTLVFNIGDLMQKWTGGFYRSSLHRVLNIGEGDRYSAPFFYNGNVDLKFVPMGDDGGKEETVEESIRGRLRESLVKVGDAQETSSAHGGAVAAPVAAPVKA